MRSDLTERLAAVEVHLAANGNFQSDADARTIREAIAALAPVEAAPVVKPLEWRGTEGVWAKADALFGATYRITEYAGMSKPFKLETVGFVGPSGHYELLPEAQAAAQADFERRILSALEPAEPSAGWRPIETAPKDGTRILLFTQWEGDEVSPEPFSEIQIGEWDEGNTEPGIWHRSAGWAVEKIGDATHWMPLPAAPEGRDL